MEPSGIIIFGVFLFTTAALIGYFFIIYNGLISLKENIQKSWANIDVILKQRYDELPKLISVCESSAEFEKGILDRLLRRGRVEEFQTRSDTFLSLPERLISVLQQNEEKLKVFKLKNSSGLFSQKYRFVEWCFQPGESVYILGYAESGIKPV